MRARRIASLAALVFASLGGAAPHALAETTVQLTGHGWGHGYGLSQWGAYGYAVDLGWSAGQILDHYYGGTVAANVDPATVVRVRLQVLDDAQTAVVSQTGLTVDGVAGGPYRSVLAREVAPASYAVWARTDAEVCPSSAADPAASGWTQISTSSPVAVIRPVADSSTTTSYGDLAAVCEPGGLVRSYRGVIRAVNGTDGENRTVNEVPIEQYLRSVIAKEMSPSWGPAGGGRGAQALQAQAVAARSYALAEDRYSYARTCDRVCQTYLGAALRSSVGGSFSRVEYPATDDAVTATAGVVRRIGSQSGPIALTMFSASSGGWTAPGPGGLVPFPAVVDEGDSTSGNPSATWTVQLTGSAITAKYPAIGTFGSVEVLARNGYGDWGGRVTSLRVTGSAGSVTVSGDAFKSAMGLKSNWFSIGGDAGSAPAEVTPTGPPAESAGCGDRVPPAVAGTPTVAAPAGFVPLAPRRLVDTRDGTGTSRQPLRSGCTLAIPVGVATTATAVALNVTAVAPAAAGFVAAYPCGMPRPTVSIIQSLPGRIVAGAAIVPLSTDGRVCVFSNVDVELVVDLFGAYDPNGGERYEPIDTTRLIDTRAGTRVAAGSVLRVPVVGVAAPVGATAAALTVHAAGSAPGFVTVYPCGGDRPWVSSLNVDAAAAVANHVEVALGAGGDVCLYVNAPMDITVDLSGWFGSGASTRFVAVPPFRALDTRSGLGLSGVFTAGANRAVQLAGTGALAGPSVVRAVVAEVTAVDPAAAGHVTVHPCAGQPPAVSMVRHAARANAADVVVAIDDPTGRWCLATSATTHLLVDVSGYFAAG